MKFSLPSKFNKIILDIILNIVASGLTVIILQLVVYPSLNRSTNSEIFGEILVMMSAVNIIGVLLGNSLNNIRLLFHSEYHEENIHGDFPVLLFLAGVANIFFMSVVMTFAWPDESIIGKVFLVIISVLTMLRAYLTVSFRIELNYNKILLHSLVYSFALLMSILLFYITELWQIVFLFGEVVSFIFLLFTTKLLKEPFIVTKKFKKIFKKYSSLCISSLISNILVYLDRIIVFPFLGAHKVAVFFAATVIGKMSSFILSPVSGVVLSYISKKKESINLKQFWIINLLILIFSCFSLVVTIFISKVFLDLFYPTLFLDALDILIIANLSVILLASTTISQTILLKYCNINFQIFIQVIYGSVYIIGGILMIKLDDLKGFCYAALFAAIIKYLVIVIVGTISLKESKSNI